MSALSLKHRWILCLAALLGTLLFAGAALAGGVQLPAPADDDDQTDQLIIKYRAGSAARARPDVQTMADAHDRLRRAGAQMRRLRGNALGANVMKLDRRFKATDLAALASTIAAHPDVEYAEPDRRMHILSTPNDPLYADQWHYYEAAGGINAPAAWDLITGSGVVVAVIDTGYRPHADLVANLAPGYDMISVPAVANDGGGRDADPTDPGDWVAAGECSTGSAAANSSWHGTHVAGTIAAVTNNASGVAGVAHGARFQPVRALGKCGGYTSDIADGILWASGAPGRYPTNLTPAKVINLSLGGTATCDTTTQAAIKTARARGAVIVVAAGNGNTDVSTSSPANCVGVIAVAAVGRDGGKAYYSNYGTGVALAAPGGNMGYAGDPNGVLSTRNTGTTTPVDSPDGDSYGYLQGTSMATPHVSAVAALMFSANPGLKPGQVEQLLKSSARAFPATCSQCGAGIVDAGAAVNSAIAALHPSLASSANPSMAGGVVTFTVTVTGDSPTGTVQFIDGGSTLGSAVALSPVTPSTSVASLDVSSLAVGSHSITAVYSGDANNAGVTSTALTQAVQATSSTVLTSSAATASVGSTVTFTATVSGASPIGTVQFKVDGRDYPAPLSAGSASYSTSALALGSHSITAVYSGDAYNVGSTSDPLTQTVIQASSSTGLTSNAATASVGATITFTATVSGASPTGTVQFKDGGTNRGDPVALNAGVASYSTNALAVGNHTITAVYSGDANNAGSTSGALTQTMAQASSSTTLNASVASLTPGQTLTLAATVSGYAPTGSVQFKDGGVDLGGTVTLVDGSASYATNTLIVGSHSITAMYSGDPNNVGSTSAVASVSVAAVAGPSGGVGGGATNADIPTLPQWGLILLGCVLLGVAHRQRPRTARRARVDGG